MLIKCEFLKKNHVVKKSPFKYFIGDNNDDDVIRPLCIKLPQMIGYVKHFDNIKKMSFETIDNKLLKKYTKNMRKSQQFTEYKILQ